MRPNLLLILLGLFLTASFAFAQDAPPDRPPRSRPSADATRPSDNEPPPDKFSITHHSIQLNGEELDYTATAGRMELKDEAGKPSAYFFFVAYTHEPKGEPSTRPVTFIFNGGPGSASIWLHMGCLGPKRVDLPPDGIPNGPPYHLTTNEQTWLDVSDLVFIDPVGTGYSRAAEGVKPEQFFNTESDIAAMADFIRLYITRNDRWLSPRFVAGESYGTTRAAGLANFLFERYGIQLNGIVFISTVLNFQTLDFADGNDLPFELYLPTYASLAIYHHKLSPDLSADPAKTRADAEHWAMTDYAQALAQGGSISPDEETRIAQQLSAYTSLSVPYIIQNHLRVPSDRFRKKLLNDQDLTIGRYDGRLTTLDPDPAGASAQADPSGDLYTPVYYDCFNDYVRRDLKYESDMTYEGLHGTSWDFGQHGEGYLDVTRNLRSAMLANPHMKVLFCSGYYDLATPFTETDYTVHHLNLSQHLTDNITQTYYPAGHMLYHVAEARVKLKSDVETMMKSAMGNGQ